MRGWDQRAAGGGALGVSQQTISALVNGRTGTGFPLALAIARELGLPVEEVLNTTAANETPDPYPNRTAALAFVRAEVPDEVAAIIEAMDVGRDRSRLWWCLRIALERDSVRDAAPAATPTRKKPALTMPTPPDEDGDEPVESETKRKTFTGRR